MTALAYDTRVEILTTFALHDGNFWLQWSEVHTIILYVYCIIVVMEMLSFMVCVITVVCLQLLMYQKILIHY